MMKSPVFIFGEFLVVAAVLIHGLNGLRIALTSFGFGVRLQRQLLFGLMGVALIGAVVFGVKMFGG
jgi:succinate dehydrogenase / fumarate reductase cytochrome b subunit